MSYSPPAYPYARLDGLREIAARHDGGVVDCSVGTPIDPPPAAAIEALARAEGARGYPSSFGSAQYREAAASWLGRRFGVDVGADNVAACVGTKEFVATTAGYLHLRNPDRDTVLYPSISYPTYAMSAELAGLRHVAVPVKSGRLDLDQVTEADTRRALVVWSNSPSNPTGQRDNLEAVANWGRDRGILVASDECYCEFMWDGAPESILQYGLSGVLAVHSISKRSNLAGVRAGFYAGDGDLVSYLRSVRQHAGFMVPGPVQSAVVAAYGDDEHVDVQRGRYHRRLIRLSAALCSTGVEAQVPEGTFYLWARREGLDGWELAHELAQRAGILVSPGEFYGPDGRDHVRIAVVQPDEAIERVASRLTSS